MKELLVKKRAERQGFVTILILIILSALTLSIILSFFELSYQSSRAGLEAELGTMARSYADSCAERGLYYFSQEGIEPESIPTLFGSYEFSEGNTCSIEDVESAVDDSDPDTIYYLLKSVGNVNDGEVLRRVEVYLVTTDAGESYQYKWSEVESFHELGDYSL